MMACPPGSGILYHPIKDGRRARKHGRVYGRGGRIEIKNSGEKEKGAKVIH